MCVRKRVALHFGHPHGVCRLQKNHPFKSDLFYTTVNTRSKLPEPIENYTGKYLSDNKKGLSSFHQKGEFVTAHLCSFFTEGFVWGCSGGWERAEFSTARNWSDGVRGKIGINGNLVMQEVSLERDCLQGDVVTGQGEMVLNWQRLRLDIREKLIHAEKCRHHSGVSVNWVITQRVSSETFQHRPCSWILSYWQRSVNRISLHLVS